jgi:serine/threonine-protein kinase
VSDRSDDSAQRAFHTLWETLHLDRTLHPNLDARDTIVPEDDAARRLDFSIVTLPNLTGATTGAMVPAQLELGPTIGQGGMAIVHLARQVALQRDVAVKTLRAELRSPESMRVLLSEAWITGLLQHPNIVPVYELGRDETGSPLLVMKRIGGTSWREFLREPDKHRDTFGKQTPLEWHLAILIQVCNAVHYAHSNQILHRDLKPDNVMIGEFGEVYLLDWGLAVTTDEKHTRFRTAKSVDAIAGTPGYMAPEMVEWGRRTICNQTDVYLLGAILHEIITGTPRHTGKTIFEVMFSAFRSEPHNYPENIPPDLAALANRATHADPDQRFSSAEDLKQAVLEFLRHRESSELAREASARLALLERRILEVQASGAKEGLEVYRSFGEARFGFEQALRVWPENERARIGLQSALRALAEYELARGNYEAASAVIDELTEPAMDLRARAEEVRRRRADREARVEHLERLEKESDLAIGRASRVRFAATLAVIWTILPFVTGYATRAGWVTVTWPLYIGQCASFGALMLGGVLIWRKEMFANEANRKISACSLLIFTVVLVHRVLAYANSVPYPAALSQELELYFLSLGVTAIAIDRRLVYSALAYLCAACGAAIFPEYFYEWQGIGNFAALTLLTAVWKFSPGSPAPV